MTLERSAPPGWLDERGASWVTVLLVLCLAAAGYLIWVWGPIYLVHYQVKQVVRDFANQSVKNPNDAQQREYMTRQLASLDRIDYVDEYGRPARMPAVNVRPENVVWERIQDPPTLRIAFEYTRHTRACGHGPFACVAFSGTFDNCRITGRRVDSARSDPVDP